MVLCEDGQWLFPSWWCDGVDDCYGGEDESGCETGNSIYNFIFQYNNNMEQRSNVLAHVTYFMIVNCHFSGVRMTLVTMLTQFTLTDFRNIQTKTRFN